jgi:hypothetical protein
MGGHTCYHCKQWVEEGEAHDCWTTTEAALTADLTEDLREAWERLRESAVELGEQRIYASHSSIMFSRKACYFFVRPKSSFLEVVVFLGRTVHAPQVHKVVESSRVKRAHLIKIRHRDEVEAPITDWIAEAYTLEDTTPVASPARAAKRAGVRAKSATPAQRRKGAKKSARKTARKTAAAKARPPRRTARRKR